MNFFWLGSAEITGTIPGRERHEEGRDEISMHCHATTTMINKFLLLGLVLLLLLRCNFISFLYQRIKSLLVPLRRLLLYDYFLMADLIYMATTRFAAVSPKSTTSTSSASSSSSPLQSGKGNKFIISNEKNNQKIIPRKNSFLLLSLFLSLSLCPYTPAIQISIYCKHTHSGCFSSGRFVRVAFASQQSRGFLSDEKEDSKRTKAELMPPRRKAKTGSGIEARNTVCFYCEMDLIYLYSGIADFFLPHPPCLLVLLFQAPCPFVGDML